MEEVVGSIPSGSTNLSLRLSKNIWDETYAAVLPQHKSNDVLFKLHIIIFAQEIAHPCACFRRNAGGLFE
jgi:hypothetical protein